MVVHTWLLINFLLNFSDLAALPVVSYLFTALLPIGYTLKKIDQMYEFGVIFVIIDKWRSYYEKAVVK